MAEEEEVEKNGRSEKEKKAEAVIDRWIRTRKPDPGLEAAYSTAYHEKQKRKGPAD